MPLPPFGLMSNPHPLPLHIQQQHMHQHHQQLMEQQQHQQQPMYPMHALAFHPSQQQQPAAESHPPAAAVAAFSPHAALGGWVPQDRVHVFRGLTILEKANASKEEQEQAAANAAAAASAGLGAVVFPPQPSAPIPAAEYPTTLLFHPTALAGRSFHSLLDPASTPAAATANRVALVKLVRIVVAFLETEHGIMDYHLSIQERRADIAKRGATPLSEAELNAAVDASETASVIGSDITDGGSVSSSRSGSDSSLSAVASARALLASRLNFHLKIHIGGVASGPTAVDRCISCVPLVPAGEEVAADSPGGPLSALLEKRPYNNVWLDAQGRDIVVVTPHSHHERISELKDEQLYAVFKDAYQVLQEAEQYTRDEAVAAAAAAAAASLPSSVTLAPPPLPLFVYDHYILNQGKYRNLAHLHLKAKVAAIVWNIITAAAAPAAAAAVAPDASEDAAAAVVDAASTSSSASAVAPRLAFMRARYPGQLMRSEATKHATKHRPVVYKKDAPHHVQQQLELQQQQQQLRRQEEQQQQQQQQLQPEAVPQDQAVASTAEFAPVAGPWAAAPMPPFQYGGGAPFFPYAGPGGPMPFADPAYMAAMQQQQQHAMYMQQQQQLQQQLPGGGMHGGGGGGMPMAMYGAAAHMSYPPHHHHPPPYPYAPAPWSSGPPMPFDASQPRPIGKKKKNKQQQQQNQLLQYQPLYQSQQYQQQQSDSSYMLQPSAP